MPLLLANPEDRFSHIKAHITKAKGKENVLFSVTSQIVLMSVGRHFCIKILYGGRIKNPQKCLKIDFNIYSLSRSQNIRVSRVT